MSAYGSQAWVRRMSTDPQDADGMREMAKDVWHQRGKIYIDPDDPNLSPIHRSFAEQIATSLYGKKKHGA